MKKQEKELIKSLCSFKAKEFDENLLKYATPAVLGQLLFNRMQGIAYGTLRQHGLLGKVNREFRNSLQAAYDHNVEKNRSYFWCVEHIYEVLKTTKVKYALLKGGYLCRYYPVGYRTSNDIDVLVLPKDVTKVSNALLAYNFHQGSIKNDEFLAATRKEIIESKMMRGETVPYIKKIGFFGMKHLEVDINFSLDYKNGETDILDKILDRAATRELLELDITTLDTYDFFIHLCCHLYKEATTMPWIEMKRDMTLYKYGDIYSLLSDMSEEETEKMFIRAKELNLDKKCAFAIKQTAELFKLENDYSVSRADLILQDDPEFMNRVISPKANKTYVYTEKSAFRRFYSKDRKKLLKEVLN